MKLATLLVFPYGVSDKAELFDLKNDPWEERNLIGQPAYIQLENRLDTQLFEELSQSGVLKVALALYKRPRR